MWTPKSAFEKNISIGWVAAGGPPTRGGTLGRFIVLPVSAGLPGEVLGLFLLKLIV